MFSSTPFNIHFEKKKEKHSIFKSCRRHAMCKSHISKKAPVKTCAHQKSIYRRCQRKHRATSSSSSSHRFHREVKKKIKLLVLHTFVINHRAGAQHRRCVRIFIKKNEQTQMCARHFKKLYRVHICKTFLFRAAH